MARLCESDQKKLQETLRQLYATRDLDEFPRAVLRLLPELVASDVTSYNEVNLAAGRIVGLITPFHISIETLGEMLQPFVKDHPLIGHFAQNGDASPTAFSDLMSARQWHKTAIYNEFFRVMEIEDQIALGLENQSPLLFGVTLNRSNRSFSARDRTVLHLLQPHLAQAHANAVEWTRLQSRPNPAKTSQSAHRVLVVRDNGRIVFCGERARQLLQSFFGRLESCLPGALQNWLEFGLLADDALRPRTPFRLQREHRQLLVHRGERSEGQTLLLLEETVEAGRAPRDASLESLRALGLTPRQSEVLWHLSRGRSNEQIALELQMSQHTVKRHLEAIYARMGVEGRGAAAHRALQWMRRDTDADPDNG